MIGNRIFLLLCTICYHLCNLKSVKNTNGGVLLLKVILLHRCFSSFINCTNGTKSRKAFHLYAIATNTYIYTICRTARLFGCEQMISE